MRSLFSLILWLFIGVCINLSYSQDTIDVYTFGDGYYNKGHAIDLSMDNGFIIGGSSFNVQNNSSDFYVIKLDSTLDKQWSYVYGSDHLDVLTDVKELPNQNILILGYTNTNLSSGYDITLLCLSASGHFLWQKVYSRPDWDFAYKIIELPNQEMVLIGETYSNTQGNSDAYLLYVNQNGDSLTSRLFGTQRFEMFSDATLLSDSSLVLCGASYLSDSISDIYLVCQTQSGTTLYEKTLSGSPFASAQGIDTDQNDHLYLSGTSNGHNQRMDKDIFTLKLSALADTIFDKVYAASYDTSLIENKDDFGHQIFVRSNQEVLNVGVTTTYGFGIDRIAFSLTDTMGQDLLAQSPDLDYSIQDIVEKDSILYMVGSTQLIGNGQDDVLLITIQNIQNTYELNTHVLADTAIVSDQLKPVKENTASIQLYPNPNHQGEFWIKGSKVPHKIKGYTLSGQCVDMRCTNNHCVLKDALPGVYIIECIYNGNERFAFTLLVD